MVNKHAKRLITLVLTAAVAAVPLFGCGAAQPMLNHSTYGTPNEESEIQHLSSMTLFLIRQELIKKPKDISLIPLRKMSLTTTNSM